MKNFIEVGCQLISEKSFVDFRECRKYTYRAIIFGNEGVIFFENWGHLCHFSCEGKVSLVSIVFAMLHMGKVNDGIAALIFLEV